MKINSIDISTFNSKLCERVIGLATINITSVWENQFLEPINYIGEYKFKPIKLVFDVKCSNNTELEIMKSKLLKQLLLIIFLIEASPIPSKHFKNKINKFKFI